MTYAAGVRTTQSSVGDDVKPARIAYWALGLLGTDHNEPSALQVALSSHLYHHCCLWARRVIS